MKSKLNIFLIRLLPFVVLAVFLFFFIAAFIFFSYVLLFGVIVGSIWFLISYIRNYLTHKKDIANKPKIYEHR